MMNKHHQDPMRHHQTTRREQTRGEYTYNRTNKTRYPERRAREQTTPTRREQDEKEAQTMTKHH